MNAPAIATENLTRRFGRLTALDGVTFRVGRGELFGVIGPDGAGKTTLMRLLATLSRPDAGRASVLESAWRHDSGVDVEKDLNMRERVGQVYSVVRQLPEQQRSVFILRDVLGYEMEEISDITGCGTDNVRQMLSRARKRIREYLMKNE